MSRQDLITLGKISGVFGLKGWLKVFSYTEPRQNILSYKNFFLQKGEKLKLANLISGQLQGKSVVIHIEGVNDRDDAQSLIGYDIVIDREQFPPIANDEYYWVDLVGLKVENLECVQLGNVESLFETGANDVLVVKGDREHAIPFIQGQTVKSVDLQSGIMIVDWDADF